MNKEATRASKQANKRQYEARALYPQHRLMSGDIGPPQDSDESSITKLITYLLYL